RVTSAGRSRRVNISRSTALCARTFCSRQSELHRLPAEGRPLGDARVGRFDFRTIIEAHPRHLDKAALSEDSHPLVADRDNLADLAPAHHAEGLSRDLARIEQIEFLLAEFRPGAGCRVAAADQVVDEVDVVGPVYVRRGLAHPAFV